MPKNDLLLRSIRKEPIERFPLWLMRQAGRYMREYRQLREKEKDFLSLCKNVELATEISLLPLKLLGVDAVIIFSDILVPLEVLGAEITFAEGEGPKVFWDKKVSSLKKYDPSGNGYVYEVIRRSVQEQDEVPVIGFGGAPFTLASYLIEGGSTREFRKTKVFMWEREYEFQRLMEILTETLIKYLSAQIEAGAHLIQIFDSWCQTLSAEDYEEYIFPYVKELIEALKRRHDVPLIYFFRGSSSFIESAVQLEADVLSIDWSLDISAVMMRHDKVFQGNLDPAVLYCKEETIRLKTLELLRSVPRKTGYTSTSVTALHRIWNLKR